MAEWIGIRWRFESESSGGLLRNTQNGCKDFPEKFQPVEGNVFKLNTIVHTFRKYGDIHRKTFDAWYSEYYGKDGYQGSPLARVDDLSDDNTLRGLFVVIIDAFKQKNDREPTLMEMADCLESTMRAQGEDRSYFKVTQADFTAAEAKRLSNDVHKKIMTRVSKNRMRDELEKYLIVYDMRKTERSDEDIKKRIYDVDEFGNVEGKRTKDNRADKEIVDEINKFYKYAERLIHNAERDIFDDEKNFPGEYWKD